MVLQIALLRCLNHLLIQESPRTLSHLLHRDELGLLASCVSIDVKHRNGALNKYLFVDPTSPQLLRWYVSDYLQNINHLDVLKLLRQLDDLLDQLLSCLTEVLDDFEEEAQASGVELDHGRLELQACLHGVLLVDLDEPLGDLARVLWSYQVKFVFENDVLYENNGG